MKLVLEILDSASLGAEEQGAASLTNRIEESAMVCHGGYSRQAARDTPLVALVGLRCTASASIRSKALRHNRAGPEQRVRPLLHLRSTMARQHMEVIRLHQDMVCHSVLPAISISIPTITINIATAFHRRHPDQTALGHHILRRRVHSTLSRKGHNHRHQDRPEPHPSRGRRFPLTLPSWVLDPRVHIHHQVLNHTDPHHHHAAVQT